MIFSIKKQIVNLHYKLINLILALLFKLLFKSVNEVEVIKKILIFRTGSIGDNICAFPAISAVKENFPNSTIDILTNTGKKNLVAIDKLIDKNNFNSIINYEEISKKELFKTLKQNKYDLFIELTQVDSYPSRLIRNMLIIRLVGIKYAFKWRYAISYIFPKFQEKNIIFKNETSRLLANFKKEGLEIKKTNYPFAIDNNIELKITSFLQEKNIVNKNKNIGIAIGSKLERNKWSIENFIKLSEHFVNKGYNVLIFGGKDDYENAKKISKLQNIFNFCGKFSPLESLQTMKFCKLMISNDTGPLHMAYSVGTPVIGLYSSREYPGKWFPPEDNGNFAFRTKNVECSICWQKGVNKQCNNNICMQQIVPENVIEKAEEILK